MARKKDPERITSTYVENTKFATGTDANGRDHLHIRGEYVAYKPGGEIRVGSPPHTWRIHFKTLGAKRYIRITSTYVENTDYRYYLEHD